MNTVKLLTTPAERRRVMGLARWGNSLNGPEIKFCCDHAPAAAQDVDALLGALRTALEKCEEAAGRMEATAKALHALSVAFAIATEQEAEPEIPAEFAALLRAHVTEQRAMLAGQEEPKP
jgi:hypothetical protein